MKKTLSLTAALALLTVATPALAQNRGQIVLTPGASSNWVQQQPTAFLNTEMAQVLPDNLGYLSTGGVVGGGLPGAALNYRRGMGGRGELAVNLGLTVLTPFAASIGAGYKQQLSSSGSMATAVNGDVYLTGIGGTVGVGAQVGLPLTFDAGLGHLTVHPRVNFPALNAGTAGANVQAAIGLMTPIATQVQLLADITPTYTFAGGFGLPIGVGARFSPTATSHIDFTVGNVSSVSPFTVGLGLLGVTGHIGF